MDKTKYFQRLHNLMQAAEDPASVPQEDVANFYYTLADQGIDPYSNRDLIFPEFDSQEEKENFAREQARVAGLDLTDRQIELAAGKTPNFPEGLSRGFSQGYGASKDAIRNALEGKTFKGGSRKEYDKENEKATERLGYSPEDAAAAGGGKLDLDSIAGNILGYAVPQIPGTLAIEAGLNAIPGVGQVAGAGFLANAGRLAFANVVSGMPTNLEEARKKDGSIDAGILAQGIGLDAALPVAIKGLAKGGKIAHSVAKGIRDKGFVEGINLKQTLKKSKQVKLDELQAREAQTRVQAERQAMFEQAETLSEKARVSETHPSSLDVVDTPEYKTGRQKVNESIVNARRTVQGLSEDEALAFDSSLQRNSYAKLAPEEVQALGKLDELNATKSDVDSQIKQIDQQLLDPNMNSEQLGELTKIRNAKKLVSDDVTAQMETLSKVPEKVNKKLAETFDSAAKDLQAVRKGASPDNVRKSKVLQEDIESGRRTASEVKETARVEERLPKDLQGSKPRYNYGAKQYFPKFKSDTGKALYIVSGKRPSKRQGDFMKFLQGQERFKGMSEAEIRAVGEKYRSEVIKPKAAAGEGGVLELGNEFEKFIPKKAAKPIQTKTSAKSLSKLKKTQTKKPPEKISKPLTKEEVEQVVKNQSKSGETLEQEATLLDRQKTQKVKDQIERIKDTEYKKFAQAEISKYPGDPKALEKIRKAYLKKTEGAFSSKNSKKLEAGDPAAVEKAVKEIQEDAKVSKQKRKLKKTVRCK